MQNSSRSVTEEQWIIWNGSLGLRDRVTIGEIEEGSNGRTAWLDEPYEMVGPFSLDELESIGKISFAACVVMSQQRWQEDQVELLREAIINRRAAQEQLFKDQARYNERRRQQSQPDSLQRNHERQHRELLNLPMEGELEPSQIKAAYRRLAQKAHPDVGGSHELFVQITQARNALLGRNQLYSLGLS